MLPALLGGALRPKSGGLFPLSATSLMVGGGAGNLFDRATSGGVIDFMNVGIGGVRTGIFNVAAVAILAGLVLLLLARRGEPSAPALNA